MASWTGQGCWNTSTKIFCSVGNIVRPQLRRLRWQAFSKWCKHNATLLDRYRCLLVEKGAKAPADWRSPSGLPKVVNDAYHQMGGRTLRRGMATVRDRTFQNESMPVYLTEKSSNVLCEQRVILTQVTVKEKMCSIEGFYWLCGGAANERGGL